MNRLLGRVARRLGASRRRAAGRKLAAPLASSADILLLQTSDAHVYFDMLCLSSRANRVYCARQGIAYQAFVGVKRGFHAWQATFNRIPLLHALAREGFAGWVLYLDADAYVVDLDFDIRAYLADKARIAAVLTPVGPDVPWWNVNAGVACFNLGSAEGRWIVECWHAAFMAIGDDALRADASWDMVRNDQDLLHDILRGEHWLRAHVFLQNPDLMNADSSRFIRQALRVNAPGMDARMRIVREDVARVLCG